MRSIKFKEKNTGIGFNEDGTPQEQYNIIHAHIRESEHYPGAVEFIMPFKLSEEELKQVQETGVIYLKRLMVDGSGFQPIGPDLLKPEGWETPQNSDEITGSEEKLGAEDFDPKTFELQKLDLSKVDYFYKKQVVRHLKLKPEAQTEEAYDAAISASKTTGDQKASSPEPAKEQ